MSALSRTKGATFERKVAGLLRDELGIGFKRRLEQWRQSGQDDLIPSDPLFPFSVECKHAKRWQEAWWQQALDAALDAGKHPALIYRLDGYPIRVRTLLASPSEASGGEILDAGWCEMTLPTFCFLAREIMARRAEDVTALARGLA